jgi:hypothetical protein
MRYQSVNLFTPEEDEILAAWFGTEPISELPDDLTSNVALERLGFVGGAMGCREEDAAVASIILERIQDRLPSWLGITTGESGEQNLHIGREIEGRRAERTVELTPRHLLSINWATSGPGITWPAIYYVTYVPLYDRFIVTRSSDGTDVYGYCDVAMGHFGPDEDLIDGSVQAIDGDWNYQTNFGQARWESVVKPGLIGHEVAEALADEVWGPRQPRDSSGLQDAVVRAIEQASKPDPLLTWRKAVIHAILAGDELPVKPAAVEAEPPEASAPSMEVLMQASFLDLTLEEIREMLRSS